MQFPLFNKNQLVFYQHQKVAVGVTNFKRKGDPSYKHYDSFTVNIA